MNHLSTTIKYVRKKYPHPPLVHVCTLERPPLDAYILPILQTQLATFLALQLLFQSFFYRSGVVPISAYTYEHLRRYMGVFAYTSNVVPNIFCLDSQKMRADAQKALGADGYWSRQINNSKLGV